MPTVVGGVCVCVNAFVLCEEVCFLGVGRMSKTYIQLSEQSKIDSKFYMCLVKICSDVG